MEGLANKEIAVLLSESITNSATFVVAEINGHGEKQTEKLIAHIDAAIANQTEELVKHINNQTEVLVKHIDNQF